eukprot:350318-Chlamydomonas_euryale.AAC.19
MYGGSVPTSTLGTLLALYRDSGIKLCSAERPLCTWSLSLADACPADACTNACRSGIGRPTSTLRTRSASGQAAARSCQACGMPRWLRTGWACAPDGRPCVSRWKLPAWPQAACLSCTTTATAELASRWHGAARGMSWSWCGARWHDVFDDMARWHSIERSNTCNAGRCGSFAPMCGWHVSGTLT